MGLVLKSFRLQKKVNYFFLCSSCCVAEEPFVSLSTKKLLESRARYVLVSLTKMPEEMITDLAKEVDATEKEHSSNIDQIRGDIKLLKGELNLMKATRNQIVEKGDLSDKEIEQFDTWVKKCISNIAVKEKELTSLSF